MSDSYDQLARSLRKPLAPYLLPFTEDNIGSFVPTWVGTTIAGAFTYTANTCLVEWSRIGNRLFFNGRIVITAIGVAPTGSLTLAGFPFAGVSDANMAVAGGGTVLIWAANVAAGYTQIELQMSNGGSAANLVKSGDNLTPVAVLASELIVGDWRIEGHYRVA